MKAVFNCGKLLAYMVENFLDQQRRINFGEYCRVNQIKHLLFDLDGTLGPTQDPFIKQMTAVCNYLAHTYSLNFNDCEKSLKRANNEGFKTHFVNPKRWYYAMSQVTEELDMPQEALGVSLALLAQIYTIPIPIYGDAARFLGFSTRVGMPRYIVTHAGVGSNDPDKEYAWTDRKYDSMGLARFGIHRRRHIYIANADEPKGPGWQKACDYFGIDPATCMDVGDSPDSDTNPAGAIGMRSYLVNRGRLWEPYNRPITHRTVRISGLDRLMDLGSMPDEVIGEILLPHPLG